VDAAGGTWSYTYDQRRNMLSATDPTGAVKRWT
jgi:YD repeat-containing protein